MIPSNEQIIEKKICPLSWKEFFITDKDLEMYEKLSPHIGGKKYDIPTPTLSPNERQIRRMWWRNYDHLYKTKCVLTGKDIISTYRPDSPYKSASLEAWWWDTWDPTTYGKKVDFSRAFFDQFRQLDQAIIHQPVSVSKSENCTYNNFCINSKNCYLNSRCALSEDCLFCLLLEWCQNCIDGFDTLQSSYLYECIRTYNSFSCVACTDCDNCQECDFLIDCVGCQHCFGSCNLKNAQYIWENKQITETEYKKRRELFLQMNTKISTLRKKFIEQNSSFPKRFMSWQNNENVIGNYTSFSKDAIFWFAGSYLENVRYSYGGCHAKDSIDISFWYKIEWCMECTGIATSYHNLFSVNNINDCCDIYYSKDCVSNCRDCFGCNSLKKGKNCILNICYSEQEYAEITWKLIEHMRSTGEWGEFFPAEYSPYAYNESAAQRHFPISPWEGGWHEVPGGLGKWHLWVSWYNEPITETNNPYIPLPTNQYDEKTVGYDTAQKNIQNLLASTIQCEVSKKPFKIIPQELAFYIEHHLPIPLRHPRIRVEERASLALPIELYERKCDTCETRFPTSYSPQRSEKVLCEECYRKVVF